MENGDVAESDKECRVVSGGDEVQLVGDTVCAFAASRRDDSPDRGIEQCAVQISQALLVGSGQISVLAKDVVAQAHTQSPALERALCLENIVSIGWAGR